MGQFNLLSDALGELHRGLIQVEVAGDPAFKNPYALLNALMENPRFAWLREISGLMVKLDELDEEGELDSNEAKTRVECVIGPTGFPNGEFSKKFEAAVKQSPDVADSLAKVRVTLNQLTRT